MILRYHFRHSRSPSPFGTVHLKQTYNVAPAALRSNCLTFCRTKVSVVNDLVLNSGKTALVAILLQAFEDDIGICRSLKEQVVDDYRVAGEDRIAFFPSLCSNGRRSGVRPSLHTQSLAADASPPEEFSKVDLLQRERITPLSFHLLQCLCYSFIEVINFI